MSDPNPKRLEGGAEDVGKALLRQTHYRAANDWCCGIKSYHRPFEAERIPQKAAFLAILTRDAGAGKHPVHIYTMAEVDPMNDITQQRQKTFSLRFFFFLV